MSLLDDASIVITPNGVKAGELFAVIPSDGAADMDFTRSTTATRIDENGNIVTVGDGVPRIDYAGGGCPHILAEPQRTNLIPYSEDFSQWIDADVTLTANATTSPSGSVDATLVDLSATTDSRLVNNVGVVASTEDTLSFYLKKHESDSDGTFPLAYYDGSNYIKTYVNLTDVWQRFDLTFTSPSGSTFGYGLSRRGTTSDETLTRCYAWSGQLEQASYPTSYIPTSGSTVTRNQELLFKDGITSLLGQTEGVYYHEIDIKRPTGLGVQTIFKLTPASGDFSTLYVSDTGNLMADFYPDGNLAFSLDGGVISAGVHQIAIEYKAGAYKMYLGGIPVDDNSDATVITQTLSKIEIVNTVYGWREIIQIYDTILTPARLAALTS